MTCGIYVLKFKDTTRVYLGQSIDIENRYLSHIQSMKAGKSSRKLMEAYNTWGTPSYEVVLECSEDELNYNENEAIQIFNSFNDGFNSLETAEEMPKWKSQLKGEEAPNAVYNNQNILMAVELMGDPNTTLVKVAELAGINYATVKKISQGVQHLWVQQEHPELWNKMLLSRNARTLNNTRNRADLLKDKFSAKSQGIIYPEVVSPEQQVYTIDNLSDFCRVHDLQRSNFRKVLQGRRDSHKGWRILK